LRRNVVRAGFDKAFWEGIDTLVRESQIVIDRPKGTHHPRFPSFVYPVDYGYLHGTASMDGSGIDVWLGSATSRIVDAIICTIDLMKKDSEVKILLGCTPEEKKLIYEFHNQSEYMKGLLIRRK
jgi:inorganic pyrophosphatase